MPRLSKNGRFFNDKGFMLIEIAIVLVIIGLIIGAAVKGRDLIQSGKQKKFYTNSLKAWEIAVVSYYDRTGQVLGDGTANSGQFSYKGQTSGNQTIILSLMNLNGNSLQFTNMPTDLAIALDTIIDGSVNTSRGSFRQWPNPADNANEPWPNANTTATVTAQYIIDVP